MVLIIHWVFYLFMRTVNFLFEGFLIYSAYWIWPDGPAQNLIAQIVLLKLCHFNSFFDFRFTVIGCYFILILIKQ